MSYKNQHRVIGPFEETDGKLPHLELLPALQDDEYEETSEGNEVRMKRNERS